MLAAGITTVAEFFYLNGAGNAHAEAAIRAARDTGIRLVLARTWMDAEYAPAEFRETIDAGRRTHARADGALPGGQRLRRAALAARRIARDDPRGRRVRARTRLHAARPRRGGAVRRACNAKQSRDGAPIALLDDLGALNERTVAIHAIYISTDDRELHRAQRRARHPQSDDQPISRRRHLRRRGVAVAGRGDGPRDRRRRAAVADRRDARGGVAAEDPASRRCGVRRAGGASRSARCRARARCGCQAAI